MAAAPSKSSAAPVLSVPALATPTTPPPATPLATPDQLSQILTALQGVSGAVTATASNNGAAAPAIITQQAPSNNTGLYILGGLGIAAIAIILVIKK